MSDKQIQEIAEKAKIIVSGYAFSIMENGFISILNLEDPSSAMVVNRDAEIIETNMDDRMCNGVKSFRIFNLSVIMKAKYVPG